MSGLRADIGGIVRSDSLFFFVAVLRALRVSVVKTHAYEPEPRPQPITWGDE